MHVRSVRAELFDRQFAACSNLIDLLDILNILLQFLIINVALFETSHDLCSLLFLAMFEKPSRRFGECENAEDKYNAEESLEGNWESPLERARVVEPESVINPVRDHDSAGDEGAFEKYQEATNFWRCHLGLPNGDAGSVHAIPGARDYSVWC